MRLPTDPAKLKLITREYIIKHCRALEKKADTFEKQLVDKYRKVCETRIYNIPDNAVAFFIEELTGLEADELLGGE